VVGLFDFEQLQEMEKVEHDQNFDLKKNKFLYSFIIQTINLPSFASIRLFTDRLRTH
jgi:hypothetical protein